MKGVVLRFMKRAFSKPLKTRFTPNDFSKHKAEEDYYEIIDCTFLQQHQISPQVQEEANTQRSSPFNYFLQYIQMIVGR